MSNAAGRKSGHSRLDKVLRLERKRRRAGTHRIADFAATPAASRLPINDDDGDVADCGLRRTFIALDDAEGDILLTFTATIPTVDISRIGPEAAIVPVMVAAGESSDQRHQREEFGRRRRGSFT